jgi:hypothetical protein
MSDRRLILGAIALATVEGVADRRFPASLRAAEQLARDAHGRWVETRATPPADLALIADMILNTVEACRRREASTVTQRGLRYLREALGAYAQARLDGGGA